MRLHNRLAKRLRSPLFITLLASTILLSSSVVFAYNRNLIGSKDKPNQIVSNSGDTQNSEELIADNPSSKETDKQVKSNSTGTESTQKDSNTESCTYRTIPNKTIYEDSPWMERGQTEKYPGRNGEEKTCDYGTGKKYTFTTKYPLDTTIVRGTKAPIVESPTQTPTQPAYSRDEALQIAINNCNAQGATSNTSAHLVCVQAYLKKFGY